MWLRHELSVGHSSLFLQAITTTGKIGGSVGLGNGGSGGLEVGFSAIGGGLMEDDPTPGTMGLVGGKGVLSPSGGGGVTGTSVPRAVHSRVGLPVVPGGHLQEGRCPSVLQSAFSPHNPG